MRTPTVRVPQVRQQRDPLVIAGPQDIYDLAEEVCKARVVPCDPADIIALDPYYDEHSGNTYNERVRHELRMHQWRISELNIAQGACERFKLRSVIELELDVFENNLRQEQPGCDWKMIAYFLDQEGQTKTVPIPERGGHSRANINGAIQAGMDLASGSSSPVGLDRVVGFVPREDPVALIQAVYADMGGGVLRDPNVEIEPSWEGPMMVYARTRAMRHMSQGMRNHRAAAERVVKKAFPELAQTADTPKGVLKAAAPEVPKAGLSEEELVGQVLELRAQGLPPSVVAKKLKKYKVSTDQVRDIFARAARQAAHNEQQDSHVDGG